MQNLLINLLTCSITMSILSLLYMVVTPFLARRYSEKGRYYVWLIIVIGFFIPFRPHFSRRIINIIPAVTTMPIIQIGNAASISIPIQNATSSTSLLNISCWHVMAVVWLSGMVVFLAYHIVKHYRFMKMVHRWSNAISDKQSVRIMHDIKADLGILKPVSLFKCEIIGSPMIIGFINPRILFPSRDFELDDFGFIIKHELVHFKRKDIWFKLLLLVATAIHWFNPIVYLMTKAVDALCEISCDVKVVRNSDINTRQYYSEAIMDVVRYHSKLKTMFSTNFYGGKNGMKKRIVSIMDTSKKRKGALVMCTALLLTLGTGSAFAGTANVDSIPENAAVSTRGNDEATAVEQGAVETGNVVYNAVIVLKNGDEVDLGDFGTKDDAYNATKQYCSEQVNLGNMTQQEADELLETISRQWDGWSETVNG